MDSILEEFAYGNVSPENPYIKRGSRYDKVMKVVSIRKSIFQKYADAQDELNQLTAVKNFVYGYKLGLLMTAEAFLTSGDLTSGEEE